MNEAKHLEINHETEKLVG